MVQRSECLGFKVVSNKFSHIFFRVYLKCFLVARHFHRSFFQLYIAEPTYRRQVHQYLHSLPMRERVVTE